MGQDIQAGLRVMHGLGGQATPSSIFWTRTQKLRKIKELD